MPFVVAFADADTVGALEVEELVDDVLLDDDVLVDDVLGVVLELAAEDVLVLAADDVLEEVRDVELDDGEALDELDMELDGTTSVTTTELAEELRDELAAAVDVLAREELVVVARTLELLRLLVSFVSSKRSPLLTDCLPGAS